MKQSTKKLTALFLSMCMAASVMTTASVSSVSAAETESAVSYDDDYAPEIAADVTGLPLSRSTPRHMKSSMRRSSSTPM